MSANCPAWRNLKSWWPSLFRVTYCLRRVVLPMLREFPMIQRHRRGRKMNSSLGVLLPGPGGSHPLIRLRPTLMFLASTNLIARRQNQSSAEPASTQILSPRKTMALERLQKIIAAAGVASRRKAEELIVAGEVMVNGHIVTELGTKADPERDH